MQIHTPAYLCASAGVHLCPPCMLFAFLHLWRRLQHEEGRGFVYSAVSLGHGMTMIVQVAWWKILGIHGAL